jgi:hypothetical protein
MRFEYYTAALDNVPKLSVDGTVGNSIHFSHWQGNETPDEVKADTSTEITLNLVASPRREALTKGIDLVTNNHFDTDGALSVWTVLTGERALELHDKLIAAAEAGDFSELSSEDGVRTSIVIQGSDQASANNETGSPLACQLAGADVHDDARAYELVLPEIERVLTRINDYEPLWRGAWENIATAIDSFERGTSNVTELADAQLSLIALAPEVFSPSGFNPTRHAAPYTAISRYAHGRIFVITTPVAGGWVYRVDYPYYSWAETVVRPRIVRQDLTTFVSQLNEIERNRDGEWKFDTSEMTSAVKFLAPDGTLSASTIEPDQVANVLRSSLLSKEVAGARS